MKNINRKVLIKKINGMLKKGFSGKKPFFLSQAIDYMKISITFAVPNKIG